MSAPIVQIDVSKIEALASKFAHVNGESLGRASMRALNVVANRGFNTSRRLMLSGVNLSESYVKERMTVEEATNPQQPVATIIAFRPGGERKPATKAVNLRQYAPKLELKPNNWPNGSGAAHRKGGVGPNPKGTRYYPNPRKPGAYLPFIPRTGNALLGVPVGQKIASISVEVVAGHRKTLKPVRGFAAFMQRMPNGEVLIMRRTTKTGGKHNKGKIESLHSLSVAQLFNFAKAEVIPLILNDLEATVTDEIVQEFQRAINL